MAVAATAAAAQPVSPQAVGNAFVQQYYQILHHSPDLVHRFYNDTSKLGRPEDGGSMSITTTMKAIDEKILSLNYSDLRAEIKSVDAQESFSGGVQVLVTGYLTGEDNVMRNFSQSFFLAPQDRGFFVLNDIFRYIENGNHSDVSQVSANDVVDPVTPQQNPLPPPVQEDLVADASIHVDEVIEGEVYAPPKNGDIPVEEEDVLVAEVVDEVQDDSPTVVEPTVVEPKVVEPKVVEPKVVEPKVVEPKVVEEVQKKSYASIVMHLKERAVPFSSPAPAPRKSPQKSQEQQPNQLPAPEIDGQVASSDASDNGNNQEGEADSYSIYVKGLPMNANVSLLENEFKKFGPIKTGGIQVRSNRQQGFCFGFVEFEVPSAVEKAIEASPIAIGGRQAAIEEKKSTNSRGSNRARFQSGRGSGFRNDGVRGRGGYGGGRGNNRGDLNNGWIEFNGRPPHKAGPSSRGGDVYQRADSNGGHMHRTGGGTAKNMAPRVSATA